MPQCPTHAKPMVKVNQGFETIGEDWNRQRRYFEDYLCMECKFRIRHYYKVLDVGR